MRSALWPEVEWPLSWFEFEVYTLAPVLNGWFPAGDTIWEGNGSFRSGPDGGSESVEAWL